MKTGELFVIYSAYFFCFVFLVFNSCKKSKREADPCAYSSTVKQIISKKCGISGCHVSGSALADFTNYEDLKKRAENGRMQLNVFELKIMPPPSADSLTVDEQEKLKCWLNNGAKRD